MLPPHRPFVEKVVRRRTVRRAAAAYAAKPETSETGGSEELRVRIGRRTAQRMKPALRVLGQSELSGATQG